MAKNIDETGIQFRILNMKKKVQPLEADVLRQIRSFTARECLK